jgi:hypothetical protein
MKVPGSGRDILLLAQFEYAHRVTSITSSRTRNRFTILTKVNHPLRLLPYLRRIDHSENAETPALSGRVMNEIH